MDYAKRSKSAVLDKKYQPERFLYWVSHRGQTAWARRSVLAFEIQILVPHMVWTVKILDIPPLPKHLHDMVNLQPQMFDQYGTARHEEGRFYQRRLYDETGMHLAATPTCMTAPPEFSQWVNHNIITGWKDVRISYFYKQIN